MIRMRALAVVAAVLASSGGCDCGRDHPRPKADLVPVPLEEVRQDGPHDVAVLEVQDLGTIRIELLSEIAPETVANFIELTNRGFYDRTTFHRVKPGFMIQGGSPTSRNADPRDDGKGTPGYTIRDEFSDVALVRGMVAMANFGRVGTAGSQFFIMHGDAVNLTGAYTIFGRVVEGMDVVDAITELEIDTYGRYGPRDRPYPKDARVTSVRIEPASG